jgi:hypothetical protein
MTYRALGLPNSCSNCFLSNNGYMAPIWGQSEVPLSQVRGIIISAYSGKEEETKKQVLVEATTYDNAGGFLRKVLRSISGDSEIDKDIFFTNAISCSTKGIKDDLSDCIIKCSTWTNYEISKCRAGAPILAASGEAVKQMFGKKATIGEYRNKKGLMYEGRPVVVTWNPIIALHYLPKEMNGNYVLPVPKFSHTYLFKQDIIRFLSLCGI